MTRNSFFTALCKVFAANTPYVGRAQGVDPKILPLLSARYI